MDDNQKIELLKILVQRVGEELNRFWTRTSIMLTINAGLLAIVMTRLEALTPSQLIVASIFGLVIASLLYQITRVGKYYVERWRADADDYCAKQEGLQDIFKTVCKKSAVLRPIGPRASSCIKLLAVAFALFWLTFIIICSIRLVKHNIPTRFVSVTVYCHISGRVVSNNSNLAVATPNITLPVRTDTSNKITLRT